jgi:hypothetical protein
VQREFDIPVVACRLYSQAGIYDPDLLPSMRVTLPAELGDVVSFYSSGSLTTLAPKGWVGAGSSGSGGSGLRVIPASDVESLEALAYGPVRGQAVSANYWASDTSGVHGVFRVGTPIFPSIRSLLEAYLSSFREQAEALRVAEWPHEIITFVSPTVVEFFDPPGEAGTGTNGTGLTIGTHGIRGAVVLSPDINSSTRAPDMELVAVAMEGSNTDLARLIVRDFMRARRL